MTSDDFEASAHKAADRGAAAANDLQENAQRAGSEVADKAYGLYGQASGAANDLYGRAKDGVQALAGRMPGNASDAYAAGQRAFAEGNDHLGRHVSRQPIEALLLAGAIGYLVGWATSRN